MSRRGSGKTTKHEPASGPRRAPGSPRARPSTIAGTPAPAPTGAAGVLAGHPILEAMPHCGECGSPIHWMQPHELREIDPEAYRGVVAGLAPTVVDNADVWWCPGCGGVGIQPYEDAPGATAESGAEAVDTGPIDEDDRCADCGTEVEWYDPAYIATIDKDAYMEAKRTYGSAALLEGDAAVCPGCGRITFFPQDQDG